MESNDDRNRGQSKANPKLRVTSTSSVLPKELLNIPESIKLGVLDHVSAPLLVIRLAFVFKQNLDPKIMQSSLSAALKGFPYFAGRLRVDKDGDYSVVIPTIATSSEAKVQYFGAQFTVAEASNITTNDVMPTKPLPVSMVGSHEPYLAQFMPKNAPNTVFGYKNKNVPICMSQITRLKDGGTILGVVVPHVVADQQSCRSLLRAWAEEYTMECYWKNHTKKEKDLLVNHHYVVPAEDHENLDTSQQRITKKTSSPHHQPLTVNGNNSGSVPTTNLHVNASTKSSNVPNDVSKAALSAMPLVGPLLHTHAVESLPPGFSSSRFERRSWRYFPKLISTAIWYLMVYGRPQTLLYYVSAERLAEIKEEAMKDLPLTTWISTNDALAAKLMAAVNSTQPGSTIKHKNSKDPLKTLQLVVDLRKRLDPPLPMESLGNCSWPAPVDDLDGHSIGAQAAKIRWAIQKIEKVETNTIFQELKWLEENIGRNRRGGGGGASMPVVYQNFSHTLSATGGPLVLSHWDWGGCEYDDLSFGGQLAGANTVPVWHEPLFSVIPNTVFVVPAPGSGALVHITLYRKHAEAMKSAFPCL